MKKPEDIKKLAWKRLKEAQILCDKGESDGAFYLAGYSVELMLKAKVCEQMGVDNLFDFDQKSLPPGVREIRQVVKTHDIAVLFMLSGLKIKFDRAKSNNRVLSKTNDLLFEASGECLWSEQIRYQLNAQNSEDIQELIGLLNHDEGLLKWIEE